MRMRRQVADRAAQTQERSRAGTTSFDSTMEETRMSWNRSTKWRICFSRFTQSFADPFKVMAPHLWYSVWDQSPTTGKVNGQATSQKCLCRNSLSCQKIKTNCKAGSSCFWKSMPSPTREFTKQLVVILISIPLRLHLPLQIPKVTMFPTLRSRPA